jgi:hypothetical protein
MPKKDKMTTSKVGKPKPLTKKERKLKRQQKREKTRGEPEK